MTGYTFMKRISRQVGRGLLAVVVTLLASTIGAPQGQDLTVGQRNLFVIAEMLPGHYDNANQHYFARRRKLPQNDRHDRVATTITRISAPAFRKNVFLWTTRVETPEGPRSSWQITTLEPGPGDSEVTMRHYFGEGRAINPENLSTLRPSELRRTDGCDYVFMFIRRADHYSGKQRPKACRFVWEGANVYTDNEIQLSKSSLWLHDHKWLIAGNRRVTGTASGEPYWLERSRLFHCYADIPGVGGGLDIPFERYDEILLHDKGGMHWISAPKGQSIGLSLRNVTWHVLNEANGNFNRNSLVLSVSERLSEGGTKEHGYAFADSGAERIVLNLKWILVNCALTPRHQARPNM